MNREGRKDLFEVVGFIAIVASLIFLAVETNQNTNAMYAQSRQSILESSQNELFMLVENPELSSNVIKEGPLTPEEIVRLDAYMAATMRTREFAWMQYRDGIIDDIQWSAELAVTRSVMDAERVRLWWNLVGQNGSSPEFAKFVKSEILSQVVTEDGWRLYTDWANR